MQSVAFKNTDKENEYNYIGFRQQLANQANPTNAVRTGMRLAAQDDGEAFWKFLKHYVIENISFRDVKVHMAVRALYESWKEDSDPIFAAQATMLTVLGDRNDPVTKYL